MATTRNDAPVAIEGDGVELRMQEVGGDMTVAFVTFPKGTDMAPALKGMPDDLCQCPHWGSTRSSSTSSRNWDDQRAGKVRLGINRLS